MPMHPRTVARIKRSLRNACISAGVLLALAIAAGAIYTWYQGQHSKPVVTAQPTSNGRVTIKPTEQAASNREGVSVEQPPAPVSPGQNASIGIKTNTHSTCTIVVSYAGVVSKDSGLGPKASDEFGFINWTWTVQPTTPLGNWPIVVTCMRGALSAVVDGQIEVVKATP